MAYGGDDVTYTSYTQGGYWTTATSGTGSYTTETSYIGGHSYSYYIPPSWAKIDVPKWWRWFDVFRIRVSELIELACRATFSPLLLDPPRLAMLSLVERARWKRRRYVQGLA